MCPRLFEIGSLTIYSYGLMLALGFIAASYITTLEFKRKKLDPNLPGNITLIALVSGIVGAKLLYIIENWNAFLRDPGGMIFSVGGLTFYGGFLMATLVIYLYLRKKRVHFFTAADGVAPGLMLAYGIARTGCHFAGDGDYGMPTTLPWGTDYSQGTYPPSLAFEHLPEITSQYPGGVVPDTILLHPTPIYEFIICAIMFLFMWRFRTALKSDGKMFMLYLMLAGIGRFSIEFIRINPRVLFGLSEAQLISIGLILLGAFGWNYFSRRTVSINR